MTGSAIPAELAAALGGRYMLERELGHGGMATVFLAQDLRHDRSVALKVLHPDLAHALGPERFQREIRLVARLQHPHILTVLDSGEAAGRLWFAMPYVEGESLRDRLARAHQLPLDDALRIATETARALDYAHRQGVIHRDIKPENILLTKDGDTLVADFGIARALTGGAERITETGMAVGTPAYMSPEQAAGERDLDAGTDIYALGAVLYEMLAGEPPFTGPTAQAVIAKRFSGEVPRVRVMRPSVSEGVEQAITRALAPVAADRFASAADFARALSPAATGATAGVASSAIPTIAGSRPEPVPKRRRVPIGVTTLGIGFLLGLGVLFAWRRNHAGAAPSAGIRSVAVLPFENQGDSADAYFADGITDEVRGKLSALSGLRVIAGGSSKEYRKTTKPLTQIAHELGVDYLLVAKVRWARNPDGTSRVQVSPELVDVSAGTPTTKWQQPFDAAMTDVFQVQAAIATKVAGALHVALGDSTRQALGARPTDNLAAYDAFLKGEAASLSMSVADPPSLRAAIHYYEQAVAIDPAFLPAWAQLTRAHAILFGNSVPSPEGAAAGRRAADRVRALGPGRADGALALGIFYGYIEQDDQKAAAALDAGLRLAPNNPALLAATAGLYQRQGRWEAALKLAARTVLLDPRSPEAAARLTLTLLCLRRYPEAQAAAERTVALGPTNLLAIERVAMVALAQGNLPGARAVMHTALGVIEPAALLAFFGTYEDLHWVLDDAQQQQLLTLPPGAFDDDRAAWGLVRAQTYSLRGDQRLARVYADSARLAMQEQIAAAPEDAQLHVLLGLAFAYLGQKAEAIREGERSATLIPPLAPNAYVGAYLQHQVVRIYLLVGEPGKALDHLEPLLRMPYYLSPGWLRIDPTFAPLRGNPRFERLIAGP